MMKFQTVERDSFFSRLDFRPKLFMVAVVTIVAFVWESPMLQIGLAGTITVACLLVGVKWSYIRTILLIMIPFYALLLLTHAFFNRDQVMALRGIESVNQLSRVFTFPENWPFIGGSFATWEGLNYGFNVIFKTLTLTLIIPLAVFTTEVDNMIVGMVRAKIPYKIAFIFSSTLRFFPLLIEEFSMIIEAQRLRGLAMEKMRPIKRVRVYAKVAVPLILGALVKSQQLEVVLQSKAFSGSPDRTYLHESILRPSDYALIIFFVLFFIAAFYLLIAFGIGTFGGPI
ncbi:MAG: energy-coupling factor transporter transmembrane protein EcfT [Anaerolineales bacterium]|nr:energy-coupling factor transporter transmembrane protein EcfT [Chloroflexota bacterium]MBL6983753.1 energy-coupling factor transporter transmembrane protein EcfT [Anaerolineales bacterium]